MRLSACTLHGCGLHASYRSDGGFPGRTGRALPDCPENSSWATSIDNHSLAAHVIRLLGVAQAKGRAARLDELASDLGVRKTDVRDVVSRLHAGHVDALRMKLTMSGLALAAALSGRKLRSPRRRAQSSSRASPELAKTSAAASGLLPDPVMAATTAE